MGRKVVTILSGGMDSATLAYDIANNGHQQLFVTFDYGQRHRREIDYAQKIAACIPKAQHTIVDLQVLQTFLGGSALTQPSIKVPHGHYQEETMRKTVVPNRNAIMLSIAWGIMVSEQFNCVAAGVHAGDHYIYPDCRPDFIGALQVALKLGTRKHAADEAMLYTPFVNLTKREIGLRGKHLGVPFANTWSCYEGGKVHCGKCGACNERQEALHGFDDTVYASDDGAVA